MSGQDNSNRLFCRVMTDIDAPMRYAPPAADRTERDGSVGLVILLALALAAAAVGLAMVERSDGPADAAWLSGGHWEVDIAGRLFAAVVSMRPLYDPRMELIKA